MADWLSSFAQAQQIRLLARGQQALDEARYFAALVQWSESPSGDILLQHWVQKVLLRPCATPEDMGEQRFLLRVLQDLRQALEKREVRHAHREPKRYESHVDAWSNPAGEWTRASEADYRGDFPYAGGRGV